jgi:hypothetical protein
VIVISLLFSLIIRSYSSSHLLIFSSSHLLIFSSSHLIFSSSYLIFSSHLLTSSSHLIFSPHLLISSRTHTLILNTVSTTDKIPGIGELMLAASPSLVDIQYHKWYAKYVIYFNYFIILYCFIFFILTLFYIILYYVILFYIINL